MAAATDGRTSAKNEVAYLLEGLSRCPEPIRKGYLGTLWIEGKVPGEAGPPSSKPKGGGLGAGEPVGLKPKGPSTDQAQAALMKGFSDRGERIIPNKEFGNVLVDKNGEIIRPADGKEQKLYLDYKKKFDGEAKKLKMGFDQGQKIIPDGKGGWVLNGADGKAIRPATSQEQGLYLDYKRDLASKGLAQKALVRGFAENGEKILPDKEYGQVLVNREGELLRPASKAELRSYLDYKKGADVRAKELGEGFKNGQKVIPDGKGGWVLNGKDGKTIRAATAEEQGLYLSYRRTTDAKVKDLEAGFKEGQMVVSDGKGGQILQGKDGKTIRAATAEERGLYFDYKSALDAKAAEAERQVEVLQAGFYVRGERIIPDKKYGNILVDRDGGLIRPASKQEQGVYLKWKGMMDSLEDLTPDAKMEPPPLPKRAKGADVVDKTSPGTPSSLSGKKAGSALPAVDKTSAGTPSALSEKKVKGGSEDSGVRDKGAGAVEIPPPIDFTPLTPLKTGETLRHGQALYLKAGEVLAPYEMDKNAETSPQALRLAELGKLPGGIGKSANDALRLLDMIRQDAVSLREANDVGIVANSFSDRLTENLARFEALTTQLKPALEGKPLDPARVPELRKEATELGGELFGAEMKRAAGDENAKAPQWVQQIDQAVMLGEPGVSARAKEVKAAADGIPKTLDAIQTLQADLNADKIPNNQKATAEKQLSDLHLLLQGQTDVVKSWKADAAKVVSIHRGMRDASFPYLQDSVRRDARANEFIPDELKPPPPDCPLDFGVPFRDSDAFPTLRANLYGSVQGKVSPNESNTVVFEVNDAAGQTAMTEYVTRDLATRFPENKMVQETPGLLRITQKDGTQFFVHIEIAQAKTEASPADAKATVPPPTAKDRPTVKPGTPDDKATVRPGKVGVGDAGPVAAGDKATVRPGKGFADGEKTVVVSYTDKTKVGAPDAKLLDDATAPGTPLKLEFTKAGEGVFSAERGGLKFMSVEDNKFIVQSTDGNSLVINGVKEPPAKWFELAKDDFIQIEGKNYVFTGEQLVKADPQASPSKTVAPKSYDAKFKDFSKATDEKSGVRPKGKGSSLPPSTPPPGGEVDLLNPVIPKAAKAPSVDAITREAKVSVDIYNNMYPSEGGTRGRPGFVGYELMRELDTTAGVMGQTGNPEIQKALNADLETVRKGQADTPQYNAAVDRLARVLETRRHLSDFSSTPVDFMGEKTLSSYSKEVGNIYSLEAKPSHVADTPPPSGKKVSEKDEWADFEDPSVKQPADKKTVPPPAGFDPSKVDKEASGPNTVVPGAYDPKGMDTSAAAPKFIAQTQKGDVTKGTSDVYRVKVQTAEGPKEVAVRLDPEVSADLGGAEKNLTHALSFVNLDKVYDAPDGGKLRFTGNVLGQGSASTVFEARLVTPDGGERMVAVKMRTHPRPSAWLAEDPGFNRAEWEADMKQKTVDEGKIAQEVGKIDTDYAGAGLMTGEKGLQGLVVPRFAPESSVFFTSLSELSAADQAKAGPQLKALVETFIKEGHAFGDVEFVYDKKSGKVHLVDIEGVMLKDPSSISKERVGDILDVPAYAADPALFAPSGASKGGSAVGGKSDPSLVPVEDLPPFSKKEIVPTGNPNIELIVPTDVNIENSATAMGKVFIRDKNNPGMVREVEVNVDPRRNAKLNPQDAEDGLRQNLQKVFSYIDLQKDYPMGDSKLHFTGRILGQGSAATVFEAKVTGPDGQTKNVAVKMITHPFKEGVSRSFAREAVIQDTLGKIDPAYKDSNRLNVGGVEGLVMPLFDPKTTLFFESTEDLPLNRRADAEAQITDLKKQLDAKGLECRDVAFALTSDGKVHIMDVEGIVPKAGADKAKTVPPPSNFDAAKMDKDAAGPPTVIPKPYFPKAMDVLAEPDAAPVSVKAAPTPRQVLGDKVMDAVKGAILSDPEINRKGQIQATDIHEISCNLSDFKPTIDKVASEIPKDQLPKTLYFVADMKRPDGSHVVSLVKHEIAADGETRTSPNNSIFTFNYRVTEGTKGEPTRVRVDYIKAREDLRAKVVNPAVTSLLEFAAKEFPGATVETRADNLISGQLAGANLNGTRFIEITDAKKYPVAKMLDPKLVDHLEKTQVLTGDQATKLKEMIARSVPEDQQGAHRIEVHNQFIQFVRENYAKNPGEASNEVSFMFQRLRSSKEALAFVRESPYRGDLWVEGQVREPKKAKAVEVNASDTKDTKVEAGKAGNIKGDEETVPKTDVAALGGKAPPPPPGGGPPPPPTSGFPSGEPGKGKGDFTPIEVPGGLKIGGQDYKVAVRAAGEESVYRFQDAKGGELFIRVPKGQDLRYVDRSLGGSGNPNADPVQIGRGLLDKMAKKDPALLGKLAEYAAKTGQPPSVTMLYELSIKPGPDAVRIVDSALAYQGFSFQVNPPGGSAQQVRFTGEILGIGSGRVVYKGVVVDAQGKETPVAIKMPPSNDVKTLLLFQNEGIGGARFLGAARVSIGSDSKPYAETVGEKGPNVAVTNLAEGVLVKGLGEAPQAYQDQVCREAVEDVGKLVKKGFVSFDDSNFLVRTGDKVDRRLEWIDLEGVKFGEPPSAGKYNEAYRSALMKLGIPEKYWPAELKSGVTSISAEPKSDQAWAKVDGAILSLAKLSGGDHRVIISSNNGSFSESASPDGKSLFSIRQGPRSYRFDAMSGLNGGEVVVTGKDAKGQERTVSLKAPLGMALTPGEYKITVNGKEMSLNLPPIAAEAVPLSARSRALLTFDAGKLSEPRRAELEAALGGKDLKKLMPSEQKALALDLADKKGWGQKELQDLVGPEGMKRYFGYGEDLPFGFQSVEQFHAFEKSLMQRLLAAGVPIHDPRVKVVIQGSAVTGGGEKGPFRWEGNPKAKDKLDQPSDIDIAIIVDDAMFKGFADKRVQTLKDFRASDPSRKDNHLEWNQTIGADGSVKPTDSSKKLSKAIEKKKLDPYNLYGDLAKAHNQMRDDYPMRGIQISIMTPDSKFAPTPDEAMVLSAGETGKAVGF
jgi:hypothetical protein